MNELIRPHPNNVAGPFYVEYGCCTACDVPMQEAPSLFAYDPEDHCYVCRQPGTEEEVFHTLSAAWMAEFQCIRYRGSDPNVLRRLAELDLRELCDIRPPADITPVIRNHVSFTLIGLPKITSARQLANLFREHLVSDKGRQIQCTPIECSNDVAYFELSWFENHFHPIEFIAVPNHLSQWHIQFPLTDVGDRGVGNLVSDWLKTDSSRFTNVKWYTDADWRGSKRFQTTPW